MGTHQYYFIIIFVYLLYFSYHANLTQNLNFSTIQIFSVNKTNLSPPSPHSTLPSSYLSSTIINHPRLHTIIVQYNNTIYISQSNKRKILQSTNKHPQKQVANPTLQRSHSGQPFLLHHYTSSKSGTIHHNQQTRGKISYSKLSNQQQNNNNNIIPTPQQ